MDSANGSCPYSCSYKNSLGYCQVTACINPDHNGSCTCIIEHDDKVIEIVSEIIKIREKYEHLAEVSYPIWKQKFGDDKNNKPHKSVMEE